MDSRRVWTVLACAAAILAITTGLRYSFGLFLRPISMNLGVTREEFSLSIGLLNLLWGLLAPFVGALADRSGVGKVTMGGGAIYAAGLVLMGLSDGPWQLAAGGCLIGVGLALAGTSTVLGAVGRVVPPEWRGRALGIVATGGSVGQFVLTPVTFAFIEGLGWSGALLALALVALTVVPLSLGLLSDGRTTGPTGLKNGTDRVSLRVVLRHRNLWLLTAGFSACGFHLAFIGNHLPAYIGDAGLPSWLAAIAISVIGAANAFGTYWFGTLGDRYPRRHVLATLYALRTLAIVAFVITPPTVATVLTFSFLMGLLWLGTVPLTSGLVAHLYGSGSMSMLYGFVFCGHQIGSFLGAWAGGWVFDATGSYGPVWAACVAIGIASAALHLPIRESHTQPKMTGTT